MIIIANISTSLAFSKSASGKKKKMPADARDIRDAGLIPGWGRSPGGGHGNLL